MVTCYLLMRDICIAFSLFCLFQPYYGMFTIFFVNNAHTEKGSVIYCKMSTEIMQNFLYLPSLIYTFLVLYFEMCFACVLETFQ